MTAIPVSDAAPVLVVEDDRDLREVLAESLQLEGYEVVEAVDGMDALERLRAGVRPAVIVLDLVMPRMDGRQFLAELRADRALAELPVVLVTGTPPRDLAGQVQVLLQKPVGTAELFASIARFSGGIASAAPGARPRSRA